MGFPQQHRDLKAFLGREPNRSQLAMTDGGDGAHCANRRDAAGLPRRDL